MVVHVAKLVTLKSVGMIIQTYSAQFMLSLDFMITYFVINSYVAIVHGAFALVCQIQFAASLRPAEVTLLSSVSASSMLITVEKYCRSFMRWTIFFASHIILQVLELIHVHG